MSQIPLVSDIVVAYTYLLTHKITLEKYYGFRSQGICESHKPEDDLGIIYFSSSARVHELIDRYGPDSFDYEIRKSFTSVDRAREWEHKALRRLKVINRHEWLNQSCGRSFDKISCQKGARLGHITQQKNGHYHAMSKRGVEIKRQKVLTGECSHGGKPYGFKDTTETRVKKSLGQTGKRNSQYGTRWITNPETLINKKISRDAPVPPGWKPGRYTEKHPETTKSS